MAWKRDTAEEIICHLRTIEIEADKGTGIADSCRTLGITAHRYSRWQNAYGGLRVDHATQLTGREQENLHLTRMVADHAWDLSILKEVRLGTRTSPARTREAVGEWGD